VALLFIDIDHFKNINDMLGHPVGDEVLTKVAHRIRSVLGEEHQVGRFGGDEFVAIIRALSRDEIEALSNRLVVELANKYDVNGNDIFSSASIGVAFYPGDGGTGEELLNAADSAMYHAKAQGRDRVALFHPSIREQLLRDAAIERGLRRSLQGQGYRLLFQPIVELADRRHVVGLEALLRWRDPELADVGPGEFIPVAERCGLVVALDRMVRTMVLDQICAWRDAGLDVPVVSINVSPWSLREHDFAEKLLDAMNAAEVPGSLLKLEITESALLHYDEHLQNNLALLSDAGIRFAIDDFGVGYSSLTYLRQLPLSELKIDRSFVSGFTKVAEDEVIALAILGLANSLALTTVAEGIETEEQRTWLQNNGFQYGQGYLLSKPLELPDISELLRTRSSPG
jgi:two-component system, chemotaxis family, CheB/CheR fusion protein